MPSLQQTAAPEPLHYKSHSGSSVALSKDLLTPQYFGAGERICEEHKPGDSMFFIEKGEVAFYTHDAEGHEIAFRTLGAGQFFGEVALLLHEPRSATARAKSEVFAYELHRDNFEAFLEAHPEMRRAMMQEMAHRLRTSGQILHHTATPDIAKEIEDTRTSSEKSVQNAVRIIGSLTFLWLTIGLFALWMVVNDLFLHWDTKEFAWLGLFGTLGALLLTVLVLAKQNRDERDSDIRANRILENTGSTERELRYLRVRIEALTNALHAHVATAAAPQKPVTAPKEEETKSAEPHAG